MSRTIRNRTSFAWWKIHHFWYDDPDTFNRWNDYDIVYNAKASRKWRHRKPNGSDGCWNDGGKKSLKDYTRLGRRNNERAFICKFKAGYDIENMMYPNEKQTKYLWWVVY